MTTRGGRMAARLAAAVAAVVPAELGRWPEAWERTAETDARFMRALRRWEERQDRGTSAALRAAFDAHVEAWKRTAELWRKRKEETA